MGMAGLIGSIENLLFSPVLSLSLFLLLMHTENEGTLQLSHKRSERFLERRRGSRYE